MSFFADVDRLVAKFKADMIEAKVAARESGFTCVKATETGVWSAKRDVIRLFERSSADLAVAMRAKGKLRPMKPSSGFPPDVRRWEAREQKWKESMAAYRARLERLASETKQQAAERKADRAAERRSFRQRVA